MKRMDKFVKFIMGKVHVSSKMGINTKENCSMDCFMAKELSRGPMGLSIKARLL